MESDSRLQAAYVRNVSKHTVCSANQTHLRFCQIILRRMCE